ncbi:MAG: lytic transglycosylase domain-containing protein [Candidatus Schekmanbacteria bacterium]|nr:lytic transglycosylase domain-containing protein [Candidatus Schekmanbacteria bacterium]
MIRRFATRSLPTLTIVLLLLAPAQAKVIEVPILLDHAFLRRALVEQVFTGPGATARVWDDGQECSYLDLSEPRLDHNLGRLRVRARAQGMAGGAVGDYCVTPVEWSGTAEIYEDIVLDPARPLVHFRVVDSNLLGADGEPGIAGELWNLAKPATQEYLERVTVDLGPALAELRALLPEVLSREEVADVERLLASLALGKVQAVPDGVAATLSFKLAAGRSALPATPGANAAVVPADRQPELSPQDLAAWENAWRRFDPFLTFVIEHAAFAATPDSTEEALQADLAAVLLEARHELLAALTSTRAGGPDPVRGIFVRTWDRLAPILRQLVPSLPGEAALHYLAFVSSADALRALDEAGPEIPLDLSVDGLRRLALMIAPDETADPLAYDLGVDARLRELFGLGPEPEITPPASEPTPLALLELFVGTAWASPDSPRTLAARRLAGWLPVRKELREYVGTVRTLLTDTGKATLSGRTAAARERLDAAYADLYHHMVLATAWQESCWRQFVALKGRPVPIESAAGAVGLMQINKRVWRGLYDLDALARDAGYNAGAGAEILLLYLRDYAIKKGEHTTTGNNDNLARATYAVYNGGPGHLRRYRDPEEKPSLRQIDELFWTKFQSVRRGDVSRLMACLGGN